MKASSQYDNVREVLLQALNCDDNEVFVRALMGYIRDDNFWENAPMDAVELVGDLSDTLLRWLNRAREKVEGK